MVKISILYPNKQNSRFNMQYYLETHMPMAIEIFSAHSGFKGVSIDKGLADVFSGTDAIYVAICHFLFDSTEDFLAAFMPHAAKLQGDVSNYTDIEPIIQVSDVLIHQ